MPRVCSPWISAPLDEYLMLYSCVHNQLLIFTTPSSASCDTSLISKSSAKTSTLPCFALNSASCFISSIIVIYLSSSGKRSSTYAQWNDGQD